MFARSLKKLGLPHFIVSDDAINSLLNLSNITELTVDRMSFDDQSCLILGKYLEKLHAQV